MIGSTHELNMIYKEYVRPNGTLNIPKFKNMFLIHFFIFIIYIIYMNLLQESIFVGVIIILVEVIISKIFICFEFALSKQYDKYIILFLVGVFTHVLCEVIGLNKLYCKYGNACISLI